MEAANIKLSEIGVGDRIREDVGDVESLREPIERNGSINPIGDYSEFDH